jgi:hypothetical protein
MIGLGQNYNKVNSLVTHPCILEEVVSGSTKSKDCQKIRYVIKSSALQKNMLLALRGRLP